jgi:hypothetical protein
VFAALTAWKENRGAGTEGLTSIINVVRNRALRDGTSLYAECVKRLQFSSITATGDPELTLWPEENDAQWKEALGLAETELADITGGATLYYAPGSIHSIKTIVVDEVTFPLPQSWDLTKVVYTVSIGKQLFFKEI